MTILTQVEYMLLVLGKGEVYTYHTGFLAIDREKSYTLSQIANAVFLAYRRGKVHLTQRRIGPGEFEYLAIGRL